MNIFLSVFGAVGLFLGLIHPAQAQSGDRLFPIVELTDADLAQINVKDGSVEDWQQVVGEPTLTAADFRTDPDYADYDPSDMDFRIWLAWHRGTNHIYVAMERSDDIYLNQYSGRDCADRTCGMGWQDSYITFSVDGDHSGGQVLLSPEESQLDQEERLLFLYQQAQRYHAISEVQGTDPHIELLGALSPADWFVRPPYAEGGGGAIRGNPAISVTEFYVTPFDYFVHNDQEKSVVSELSPGRIIGFAISVLDVDMEDHHIESIHYLRAVEPDWTCLGVCSVVIYDSDDYSLGLLMGSGGAAPEVSAVESDTWARIKASFGK
jgi:hypothetical protein